MLDLFTVRSNIGTGIWNRAEAGLECQGQRHQRTVIVERGQCTTFREQCANTVKPLQQPEERLCDLENDCRAGFEHQFRVAAKLNGVTQTLLAMKQYCLVAQWFFSKPKGLREFTPGFFRNF